MNPQAKPFSEFASNRYISYPHNNGFADGGASMVIGQIEQKTVSLWKRHLASGKEVQLGSFPVTKAPPEKLIWFDVAIEANRMVAVVNQSIWLFDLTSLCPPRKIYQPPANYLLNCLPSITADGRRMLMTLNREAKIYKALLIDLETGEENVLFEHNWHVSHLHFSPADPNWIGFAHEGRTEDIPDRVWVWHAEHAPQGRCLFDQMSDAPPTKLCLGHERWSFHTVSTVVVAYGVSPAGPRGLYELFADGRPARLISPGERDYHCDVSRDGRWAVVDTTGPHDAPGIGWENALDICDIILVDLKTGRRKFLARSRQYKFHPRHPHPVFSPDGSTIFYNEAESGGDNNRIMEVSNPWKEQP